MARTWLSAMVLLPLLGCATELHVITPITHLAIDGVTETPLASDASTEGTWLARSVYDNKGVFVKVRVLRSIEILFCPMKKGDFSSCRQGVGWSNSKNPLVGNQGG